MSGGVNPPKGRIWRDVDIHHGPGTGKTYAYVGAQSNGELWVVDLSYLSGDDRHGVDSNPIPPAGIANRGRTNYGHTMFVNDGLGLLFMNSANNALHARLPDLRPAAESVRSADHRELERERQRLSRQLRARRTSRLRRQGSALCRRRLRHPLSRRSTSRTCGPAGGTTLAGDRQPRCPAFTRTATGWTTTRSISTPSRNSTSATSASTMCRIRRTRRR